MDRSVAERAVVNAALLISMEVELEVKIVTEK